MPSSRATPRNDRLGAPTSATWRLAAALISLVSSARARARTVVAARGMRALYQNESTALDFSRSACDDGSTTRAVLSQSRRSTMQTSTDRYLRPGRFTQRVFNPLVRWLTRRGLSVQGSRELRVVGRKSGAVRTTVVNLL